MELAVYNRAGEDTGKKVQLDDAIFGIEPNDHAIWLDVKQHLANKRQGTHKSKERADIVGSTRKIKKQKGTGTARFGSIKNPLFRGGGRVFGPKPRDYSFKLNKKLKQLARRSALTYKAQNNQLVVIEDFSIEQPKSKEIVTLKQNLNVADKKSLLVLNQPNKNIYLSSRNVPGSQVMNANELSTYTVMNASSVIVFESAVSEIQKLF